MKRLILIPLLLVATLCSALAQPRTYLSSTNGIYVIPILQIGGQQFTNLAGIGLTNDNGTLKVIGGLGGGDAYLAADQIFTGTNQFLGPLTLISDLYANSIVLASPGPISAGFTGAGTAEGARSNLALIYDVNVQAFRLPLLQLAVALAASGDVPYRNAAGIITNITSTAAGRQLLTAALASDQLGYLGALAKAGDTATGPIFVPYVPYSANWTNLTSNGVPTWRSVAEKIEALSIGAYISSVDTNFEVVGGQLRVTNVEPGAAGTIVLKSQLDSLAVTATNSTLVEVLTNATGTWFKNSNAKMVRVIAIGGGAGGGSGAQGTNGGFAGGGGGGGGGGMSDWIFLASELPSSLSYTNGVGGAGGGAQTADLTNGTNGVAGGITAFGTYVVAAGGQSGIGGLQTGSPAASANTNSMYSGTTGGAGSGSGTANSGGLVSNRPGGGTGGGGGGGYVPATTTTNAAGNGGMVSHVYFLTGGAAGTEGSINGVNGVGWPVDGTIPRVGTGGGGGYPGFTGSGAGGLGGFPGGGGGGGAGSRSGTTSGAGGAGANGVLVVITHF